jgi:competence protein ComEC
VSGRRKKEEGRRKKEEGRRKKEEGRKAIGLFSFFSTPKPSLPGSAW